MEWEKLLEELRKIPTATLASNLHTGLHEVYQVIHNAGHTAATNANTAKITALEGDVARLTRELTAAKAGQGDPDEKDRKIKALETKLEETVNSHKAELEKITASRKKEKLDAEQASLAQALEKLGVKPRLAQAEAVLHRDRLHVKDDLTIAAFQADRTLELTVPAGKTAVEVLAADIFKTVPKEDRVSHVERGGGATGDTSGPGGKSILAEYQENQKKAREGQKSPLDLDLASRVPVGAL